MRASASWLDIGASASAALPAHIRARYIAPGVMYAAVVSNEIRVALA